MGDPLIPGTPTDPALYLQLFHEFDRERYGSRVAEAAITRLGPPALIFRGFAHARRRAWTSARADFEAALARDIPPLLRWVIGAGLVGVHAHDRGLEQITVAATLAPAPAHDRLGVRVRARKLAVELMNALGWIHEARTMRERLAADELEARHPGRVRELQRRREAARQRQIEQACEGPLEVSVGRAYALLTRLGPEAAAAALATLEARHGPALELTRASLRLALVEGRLDDHAARFDALAPARQAALKSGSADYFCGLDLSEAGRHHEAAELLERVRAAAPDSATVAIALAIARFDENPDTPDEGIEHRFDELWAWAPALLADAAERCDQPLWRERGSELDRPAKRAILGQAQAMITAERDLELTSYRGPVRDDGRAPLRHLPLRRPGSTHLARLEPTLATTLERHEEILMWALGIEPRTRSEPRRSSTHAATAQPWTARALDPEQIEQFITDGFLVVPGAFSPTFARQIRDDAIARIRQAPEAWVRGYDPSDPTRSLARFDPADPKTWTWDRIELVGPDNWDIEAIAPRAWAAICDLLGGPDRIATRVWGNYLLLALRHPQALEHVEPSPDSPGWHIDDPPPIARLDNFRNGLVCIALFDDVAPRSGNTWVAPESVALVARELADHPEGLDFIARRGADITAQCQRFVEVTGQTGDVLLMHPLLMHSASNNPSDRIRWMANPMVYMHESLDPHRPEAERSPVERAIARAL